MSVFYFLWTNFFDDPTKLYVIDYEPETEINKTLKKLIFNHRKFCCFFVSFLWIIWLPIVILHNEK